MNPNLRSKQLKSHIWLIKSKNSNKYNSIKENSNQNSPINTWTSKGQKIQLLHFWLNKILKIKSRKINISNKPWKIFTKAKMLEKLIQG